MIKNCYSSLNGKIEQKVRFTLKGTTDGLQQVYMSLTINGERCRHYTGIRVLPEFWDKEAGRVQVGNSLTRRQFTYNRKINERLERMLKMVEEFVKQFDYSDENDISVNYNVEALKRFLSGVTDDSPMIFFQKFVDETPLKMNKKTNLNNTQSTKIAYRTVLRRLDDFYKYRGIMANWDYYTSKFEAEFRQYLTNVRNLAFNTIQYTFQVLRIFLKEAHRKGLLKNTDFENFYCTPNKDSDSIYLTIKELDDIFRLDLSDNRNLDISRDLFIVGAFTGLRWSDYSILSNAVFGEEFMTVTTKKTNKKVMLPVTKYIRYMLEKYDYQLPNGFSTTVTINHLHKICLMAGIEEVVNDTTIKGGALIKQQVPKYEMCGTHTARRSFCTNFYLMGVDVVTLMTMSGHSSQEQFFKYIRVTQEQQAYIFRDILIKNGMI